MPYVPFHPKPKPPPPYVPPPASTMKILSPTAGSTSADATPTIVGTAPGAGTVTVLVKQGTTTLQTLTATPAASKSWQVTATTLANGNYTVTATQGSETAGPVAFTVTVGTPPAGITITSPTAGSVSQTNTPIVVGQAGAPGTVTVLIKQGVTTVQTLTATPTTGTWQTAPSPPLAEGVYQVSASQGASTAGPVTFTVDVPQPAVAVTSVGGQSNGGQTTDTTPTITGTAQNRAGDTASVTVTILFNGSTVQTLPSVPVSGTSWTVTPTTQLPPQFGWYTVRASQASTYGTGTSGDFLFTVASGAVLPTPTITNPTEGQTLSGNPVAFSGTGSTRSGDGTLMTLRVYPQASSTPIATQSVQRLASGPWSLSLATNLTAGTWRAAVSQPGSSGTGTSPTRTFTFDVPVAGVGLAMPQGPVNGFSQAADFYDSVGICHHPQYFNAGALSDPATDAAINAMHELGLRHVRLGLDNPATHGNYWRMQQFMVREQQLRGSSQPIHAMWGTPAPPAQRRNQGYEIYTVTNTDGTFLRSLDGPAGHVTAANWTATEGGGKKYSTGDYFDMGWGTAGALQGPNEPEYGYENGVESNRWICSNLQDAKNARTQETVLSGGSYINSNTGRITAGPAKAPQLPAVSFSITSHNTPINWNVWGNYANRADVDVGSFPNYWGGHSPIYDEQWALNTGSRWGGYEGFNGAMATGSIVAGNRFVNSLPCFVAETGYIQRPGSDPGSGQRYCPPDVAGEYLIRTLVINYRSTICRRTYLFSLHDVSEGNLTGGGRMGICGNIPAGSAYTSNFDRRASFRAVQNLLAVVGWRQGTTSVPISVPHTYTNGPSMSMPSKTIVDRLDKLIFQISDTEYLIVLVRQSQLWNRDSQSYMTPDTRNVVLTLPTGTWTASVCEPAKQAVGSPENPSSNPPDGQTYPSPTNGQAFAAAGTTNSRLTLAGNTLTVGMTGLTRVVKITKPAGGAGNDAAQRRIVMELT